MTAEQRKEMAQEMCGKLASAKGPTTLILPLQGGNDWDRPGGPLSDPEGLEAFIDAMRASCPPNVDLLEIDADINDAAFSETVLKVFDSWLADGTLSSL